jgi:hypothetical protein
VVPATAQTITLLASLAALLFGVVAGLWWLLIGPGRRVNATVQGWLAPWLPSSPTGQILLVLVAMHAFGAVTALVVRRSTRRDAVDFETWRTIWNTRAAAVAAADGAAATARTAELALPVGRGDAGAVRVGPLLGIVTPIVATLALVQVVLAGRADLTVPLAGIVLVSAWMLAIRIRISRVARDARAARAARLAPVVLLVPGPRRVGGEHR